MFQKPAFGSTTANFGSFNSGTSTASPFGGFKPTTGTSAFGAPPAFGAATSTQPATGGGLFGTTNTTGGGLFGGSTASTSTAGFGASTSGFGFGAAQPATGGLFGNTSTVGGGLFGATHNQTAFGAKPTGFGFGGTTTTGATTGSLFGSTPSTGTGLFGQQTNTLGGGGLFSTNTAGAFGQQQQQQTGTAHVKYNPVVGTDVVVKSGTSQSVNIKHHCITCMKEYETKSLEELRLEDYVAGRKGNTSGVFGGFQQQTENKPLFGNTSFGQPATTSAPSVFGGGSLGGAGGFAQQPSSFSFANNAQTTNTTGLFGANKPAFGAAPTTGGTGLFGATTTQAPSFGTNTSTFGFGATTQNQQQAGGLLFGAAKPAATGFGAPPASAGFGAFGSAGVFGAKTQAPSFATQAPAFGSMTTGAFGTTTSSAGGLFGGHQSFGKPTTAPTFGFNTQQPGLGTGLGGGLGSNQFQAKPAAPAFGQLGATMFPQQTQNNTFKTGLDSGLGGGMFGNNSSLGGMGMGMGGMMNNPSAGMNNSLSGSSAGGNVHEQILTLAARPYGDSPLFKDLLPDSSTTAEDVLKPTNPAAVKAVLDSSSSAAYRVSSPNTLRLTVTPRTTRDDKKSLFDGLEESDASLEDKLCLKPSRKRLVLRPNQRANDSHHDSVDHTNDTGRSLEEHQESNGGLPSREMASEQPNMDEVDRRQDEYVSLKNVSAGRQADISSGSDRHGSWLSSSKLPWNDKEKPIDGEPTPRLYPNLDKDIQVQASERRASWLTTKPLRPPLVNNPDSAENSVRELAVRSDRSHDKENIDTLSMSEEEHVSPREAPPHPTGVKLTRPGYYTIPTLDEMIAYMRPDGSCVVPHLTIGRKNYGNVYYDCEIDVAGMDLDSLVHFLNKEVIVYPEESVKPPLGSDLNRRAIVTLDRVWPRDKSEKRAITSPDRLLKMEYECKLRRVCDKHNTKFIEYRPQTGSWVFRVEHFSKYGLTDSDEEEDVPQLMKRQLVSQALQGSAAPAPVQPVTLPAPGLGGLGSSAGLVPEDNLFAMQQTSLNLLNGAAKAFEMDTTEDNTESQSLYLDNKAYGVKSPTSELARLEHRQSHNVQLMKASLYADTEMEDDVSVSTGDQLVPVSVPLLSVPSHPPSAMREDQQISEIEATHTEETPMRPLIVRPHTIVLKYHRKVPPFKQTIAGRLDAACISDMSVCRARHSRVGFGPAGALTFATSYDSVNDLPRSAELSELGKYVRGRSQNDWSEPFLVRMALGQPEKDDGMLEVLKKHLAVLLEYSTFNHTDENQCARLSLSQSPSDRRAVLTHYLRDAANNQTRYKFGVSGAYCYEVWRLCDALWGADLENDGIPGTDPLSTVNRHRKLLDWLKTAVAEATDEDLSRPTRGETEDEADGHSARIWTLMLGGRILEACKVAKEHGDLNMAILIAQAAGDPTFRSLITRQLSLWRECGADTVMSSHRWATLQLIAGQSSPREKLLETDWLRALHATARYLCPHIPSLEQVTRTYEGFFTNANQDGDDDVDLSLIDNDEMSMKLPLPPYVTHYDITVVNNGKHRRVLDLRYELIRARAFNSRPKLRPAAYTPDPLDYSLCFLLGTWFGNPSIESITGTADQLEASGAWHLAVQALSYHPEDIARGHLIRGVLSRHAPAKAETADLKARLELIRRLKVPEQWLLLAQAHRAKYERLPAVEAEHLVGAGQWNAAHKVLLEELLPEAVLADDLQSIAPILEKMNEAAQRDEVSGWETGGQALHCYLHVCDEIRGLVSSAEAQHDRSSVHARLEALRPKVAAACRALGGLQPKSVGVRFARTEMGARLVQCTLAAQEPPAHLAALLRALKLPPDTTHAASHKISSLLASRAAESCGISAASPPSARAVAS